MRSQCSLSGLSFTSNRHGFGCLLTTFSLLGLKVTPFGTTVVEDDSYESEYVKGKRINALIFFFK